MANHTRTKADADWVDGYAPTRPEWKSLGDKVFASWNGDRGGAYAPLTQVAINNLAVTGPLRLTGGGSILAPAASVIIPAGTWPKLAATHVGRTRRIVQAIHTYASPRPYLWSRNHPCSGVGSVALAVRQTYSQHIETPEMFVPIRVIDGSVMSKVEVSFRVAFPRTKAPIAMPKFRVLRRPMDPLTEPIVSLKATADGSGFQSPELVSSGAEWYSDGNAQLLTYVCDQNHTIDVSKYTYLLHVVEEQGVVSFEDPFDGICFAERKRDVDLRDTYVSDSDNRYPNNPKELDTFDELRGYTDDAGHPQKLSQTDGNEILTGINRRILLANYTNTDADPCHMNGIWDTVGPGTDYADQRMFKRTRDLDSIADFSPNWIVLVRAGWSYGGAVFQCQFPASNMNVPLWMNESIVDIPTAVDVLSAAKVSITPARPRGNIYHSVVPTFEVTDLRFQ